MPITAILIVATAKRKAIVLDALTSVPHKVCWTTDYKLPEGWKPLPEYASLVHNQVGAYRCWAGHRDALAFFRDHTNADYALILEDDAWPNTPFWTAVVAFAAQWLSDYEVVSLHGRAFSQDAFNSQPIVEPSEMLKPITDQFPTNILTPNVQGSTWVQGSLAYLIRRDAVDRWINDEYNGYPSDIYLCNKFKFALVNPSPFDHNRSAGSLVDCPTPKD